MQISEIISIVAVERNIVKSNFHNQINNKGLIRYNKTNLKGQKFVYTYWIQFCIRRLKGKVKNEVAYELRFVSMWVKFKIKYCF